MLTLVLHDNCDSPTPLFALPDGADVETALGAATKQAVLYNFAVAEYNAKRNDMLESLDRVTGRTYREEVLREIFGRFCIGK